MSLFSIVQIWVLRLKFFFLQFLVDIFPLGSGSVDPHIFADPDQGSQNLADPTDPDPKHCFYLWKDQQISFVYSLKNYKFQFWLIKSKVQQKKRRNLFNDIFRKIWLGTVVNQACVSLNKGLFEISPIVLFSSNIIWIFGMWYVFHPPWVVLEKTDFRFLEFFRFSWTIPWLVQLSVKYV